MSRLTLEAILEMIFPANHLTGAKMGSKPDQTATKLQYKGLKEQLP